MRRLARLLAVAVVGALSLVLIACAQLGRTSESTAVLVGGVPYRSAVLDRLPLSTDLLPGKVARDLGDASASGTMWIPDRVAGIPLFVAVDLRGPVDFEGMVPEGEDAAFRGTIERRGSSLVLRDVSLSRRQRMLLAWPFTPHATLPGLPPHPSWSVTARGWPSHFVRSSQRTTGSPWLTVSESGTGSLRAIGTFTGGSDGTYWQTEVQAAGAQSSVPVRYVLTVYGDRGSEIESGGKRVDPFTALGSMSDHALDIEFERRGSALYVKRMVIGPRDATFKEF